MQEVLSHDYDGDNNEFKLRGQIVDLGERSIKLVPEVIIDSNGKAEGWFDTDDETRVHNNYKNELCNVKEVDNVILDESGEEQAINGLQVGDWVEVEGRIRESKTSCSKTPTWDERPVFNQVEEVTR